MTISEQALRSAFGGQYRTLASVGRDLGVTRERVRQLVNHYRLPLAEWRQAYRDEHWDSLPPSSRFSTAPRSRWPREGLAAFKRTHGFCVRDGCHRQAIPGRLHCLECLQQATNRRIEHHKRGLCVQCSEPAPPGRHYCVVHLADISQRNHLHTATPALRLRWRAWRRARYSMLAAEGRCPKCGGVREDQRWRLCSPCRIKENRHERGGHKDEDH